MAPDDPLWPRAGAWLADHQHRQPAEVAIVGVPTHATSLSPTSAHLTPRAVRTALQRYATAWGGDRDLRQLRICDHGDVADPDARERETTAELLAIESDLLLAVGGDNSATVPVAVARLGQDRDQAGLVTFDAHHDIRTGRSNGSPVRQLIEWGLDPNRIVQLGIADFANSAEYARQARDWGIRIFTTMEIAQRGLAECVAEALAIASAGSGPVHIDVDVDVCDRSVAPACPASLPGGWRADQLLAAVRQAATDPAVTSMDFVEVDAEADAPDQRTVRLVALGLLHAMAGYQSRGGR
jgi:formiminoglutamase